MATPKAIKRSRRYKGVRDFVVFATLYDNDTFTVSSVYGRGGSGMKDTTRAFSVFEYPSVELTDSATLYDRRVWCRDLFGLPLDQASNQYLRITEEGQKAIDEVLFS